MALIAEPRFLPSVAPTLVLLLAGCASDGRVEAPPATDAGPAATSTEPRAVRIVTAIVDEDGAEVRSGMHYTFVRPDGGQGGGGSTGSPMDIDTVAGAQVRISASEEGFVPVLREFTVPGDSETHQETIVLRRVREWGSLRIRLQAEEWDLPEAVRVEVLDLAGNNVDPFYGSGEPFRVDPLGNTTLAKVPPGAFRIEVTGANRLRSHLQPAAGTVTVEEGKEASVELRLVAGGRIVCRLPAGSAQAYWEEGPDILDASGTQVGGLLWGPDGPDNWQNPPPRPGPATHENGLPPGRYRVEFGPREARRIVREVEVRARETTEVDLTGGN